jgi:hypothetical protein
MMLIKLCLYLLALNTLVIALTRLPAVAPATPELHRALVPPLEQCRLPCWQGLRPSATGYAQALDLVHQHPWINQVSASSYDGMAGWIEVEWSADRPAWLLQSEGDGLRIDQNLVERISLRTALTPADLWLLLGPPNWTRQYISPPTQYLVHGWQRYGMSATMEIPCWASLDTFWHSPVNLTWVMFLPQTGDARPRVPADLITCREDAR